MKQTKQTISDNVLFNAFLKGDCTILNNFYNSAKKEIKHMIDCIDFLINEFLKKNDFDYDTFSTYFFNFLDGSSGDFLDFNKKRENITITSLDFCNVYRVNNDCLCEEDGELYFPQLEKVLAFRVDYLADINIFSLFDIYQTYKKLLYILPFIFCCFLEEQKES